MERDEASRRAAAMVVRHGETLQRVARSVSLCADDAQDAVQRALVIYLSRLDEIRPESELAYLKVVVRNEALAVRRGRRALAPQEFDADARPSETRPVEEQMLSAERVEHSTEALAELRADEAKALVAKAAGLSYLEIAERFEWSYTRTNRNITRGRARFMEAFRGIESGERCADFGPAIAALAAGGASSDELVSLRPHLRRCSACRAAVRELHGVTRGSRVAAALLLPAKWLAAAKAEAYALGARASETAAGLPWGGGRTAAATALIGLCAGGAGGLCAITADRHDPPEGRGARVATHRTASTGESRQERRPRPVAYAGRPRIESRLVRTQTKAPRRSDPANKSRPANSEEFLVQPSGRTVASAARFEPDAPEKHPQTHNSADLEFSVAG